MKATLSYPISFCSVIVHRTQSNQTADAIHADGERNPIRLRSPSNDLNAKCTNTYQGVHLSPLGFAACQSKKCTNKTRSAPTKHEVYQQNIKCTATTLVHLRQVHPLKDYCM